MKKSIFRLLNPKNLQREVHVYGYHFSWKNQLLITVSALAAMAALGILFQLPIPFMLVIFLVMLVILPVLILSMYKRMYEQKRFADIVTDIEQLMYSFQKNGKAKLALMECEEAFGEGEMRTVIVKAIDYINKGQAETERGIIKEALEMIERAYSCKRIHLAHELVINAEEDGGEVEDSIALILEDTENWKRRVYKLQAEKKQSHTDNMISIIVATLLCAMCLYVIDHMRVLFQADGTGSIFQNMIVQISSEIFILFSMFVFTKSWKSLTGDWVREDKLYDDKKIRSMYREVIENDNKSISWKNLLATGIFGAAAVLAFFLSRKWICILLLLIAAFLLVSNKLGQKLVRQDVTNAIYVAFPQWLMEMALLLQNNNVQISIMKSAGRAPAVLEQELDRLIERMKTDPDKLSTYTGFCSDFSVPEALSCMKMLHSISESGVGNAKVQIHNLLGHMSRMQDAADHLMDENMMFKMHMIFSYPVFAAAVKMLIDMTVGMFLLFQIMGSVGGFG